MKRFAVFQLAVVVLATGCSQDDLTGPNPVTSAAPALNTTAVEDVTAPTLAAFSFSPTPINTTAGPATVTVDFTVTDDLSGAVEINARFLSPSGLVDHSGIAQFPAATVHTGSFTIDFPQFSESGTWTVVKVVVLDAVGNSTNLVTAELAALNFPTELIVGPLETEVSIDIKPGSFPNSINLKNKGLIPVAILTTSVADGDAIDFDATTVDASTVKFGPNEAEKVHPRQALGHIEDVDGDGDLDLLLHFDRQETSIACGATDATLTGETLSGQAIEGTDSIKTVGC